MRRNKKKKIIIISLIGILILMTVGYAAFQTNLQIKGTSKINSNWNVLITNVTKSNVTGTAEETKAPTWDNLTAYMEADLYEKGDSIEYIVTIENRGTIDAVLNNVSSNKTGDEAIKFTYSGVNKNDKLYKGESTQIKVKIEYNPEYSGTALGSSELNITLDYIQAVVGGIEEINPNLYVSSSGNDEVGVGSKERPYRTIKKAYEEAKEESTIYIMDDIVQTEPLKFNEEKNITLTSYGVEHSIIRDNNLEKSIIYQTVGNVTLTNIVIDGNNIPSKSALLVLNNTSSTLNISDNTIVKNNNNQLVYDNVSIADTLGGGVCVTSGTLLLRNASIINNTADYGGGIYSNNGILNIEGSNIMYNTSKSNGGGITSNSNILIKNSEVSHNTTTGAGGGMYTIGNEVNLISVKFSDNSANLTGGAIYASRNLNISENSYITNNKAKQTGGGIKFSCSKTGNCTGVTIKDTTISKNTGYNGGGIEFSSSILKISNSNINENIASEYAGGLHITNFKEATIENSNINSNQAAYGGGINTSSSSTGLTLNITNTQIKNNIATTGGGIRIDRVSVIANNTTISGNQASLAGGVSCRGAQDIPVKFTFNGTTIRNNTATSNTGGVYITDYCTYTRTNGTVCANKPSNSYETHATCPAS